jgi:DNA modification methylase
MSLPHQAVQAGIDAAKPFEEWYRAIQAAIPYTQDTPSEETRSLVKSDDNAARPIHRWYTLKEAFAAELPSWLCRWMQTKHGHTPKVICDPCIGGGTTGVALANETRTVVGVEYNPFIRFVAETKAAVPRVAPGELERAIRVLADVTPSTAVVPALTTLHKPEYCDEADLQFLLGMLEAVQRQDISPAVRDVLRLGIAAAIENVFQLRKDGRALRHVSKPDRAAAPDEVRERWQGSLEDVRAYHDLYRPTANPPLLYQVYGGSAVDLLTSTLPSGMFDTVLYSPPYANDFDYSEVYKLELWILGFLRTYDEWTQLRRGTIRSHRSIVFSPTQHLATDRRTKDIAAKLQSMGESGCLPDSDRRRVRRLIEGYFDDMYQALCEQWRVLLPGGMMVYVVANSRHYCLPLATDLVLAEIARCIGFEPLDLVVLEQRNGRTRQKQFLRESAVFFRKPAV